MSNKNNKHHNFNNYKNNNNKQGNHQQNYHNESEKHNNTNKQQTNNKHDKSLNENEKLREEINILTTKLKKLEEENLNYKIEIAKINADYIKKIMQKSTEAQELIKAKQAELDERFKTELDSQIANYIEKKFGSFLDSINQLNRIINSSSNSSNEVRNYLVGFKMILDLFYRALSDLNISIIDINVGDEFDENYMSAFEAVHVENMKPNTVVEVISPAYKFMDKVIKHGLVKVQK